MLIVADKREDAKELAWQFFIGLRSSFWILDSCGISVNFFYPLITLLKLEQKLVPLLIETV